MTTTQNYPFPGFDNLSPSDQKMVRDFDNDPSTIFMMTPEGPQEIHTAAQMVDALEKAGILGPARV